MVSEKFVGGSNWSSAYVYTTQQGKEYFVKLAMGGRDDSMFQGEAQGLQAMYGECNVGSSSKWLARAYASSAVSGRQTLRLMAFQLISSCSC